MAESFRCQYPCRRRVGFMRDFPLCEPGTDEPVVDDTEPVPDPKDGPLSFVNPDHSRGILDQLCKQREEGRFLDCQVMTANDPILAHQTILAAAIPYIDRMLKFKQEQGHKPEDLLTVDLSEFETKSVAALIDYVYRGEMVITQEDVQDLLPVADFLCMETVSSACVKYICGNLDVTSWLPVLQFASSLNNVPLINKVKQFITRHFSDVMMSDEVLQLEPDIFLDILRSDELVITEKFTNGEKFNNFFVLPGRQEELILRSALRYAQSNPEWRKNKELLLRILSEGVRLPLIPINVLQVFHEHELFAGAPDCLEVIDKAIQTTKPPRPNPNPIPLANKTVKRKRSNAMETLLLGCVTGGSCSQGSLDVSVDSMEEPEEDLDDVKLLGRWAEPRSLARVLRFKMTNEMVKNDPWAHFTDPKEFNDSDLGLPVQYVTGMQLHMRRWDGRKVVGGIRVTYNHDTSVLHGADNYDFEVEEFTLPPDERITVIHTHTGWMMDAVKFTTNKGTVLGPYGGPGGGQSQFTAPGRSGYLAYIKGKVQLTQEIPAVRHIVFVWAYNEDAKGT